MALTTAQKRQVLRLPTVDATVDSLDQKALLGVFDVETTAPTLATALKRQILRLPTPDGSVDETDAFAFLQTPESGGGGNEVISFELGWTIDPTYQLSEVENSVSGAISPIMEQFSFEPRGFSRKPVAQFGPGKPGRSSKRRPRIRLRDNAKTLNQEVEKYLRRNEPSEEEKKLRRAYEQAIANYSPPEAQAIPLPPLQAKPLELPRNLPNYATPDSQAIIRALRQTDDDEEDALLALLL